MSRDACALQMTPWRMRELLHGTPALRMRRSAQFWADLNQVEEATSSMQVARYNYRHQFAQDLDAVMSKIREIMEDGEYILSQEVSHFEASFAAYLNVRHVIGVNSGTDALLLALKAAQIGPGDEVITHANTFHATVLAIRMAGATPVLVDADPSTFLMNTGALEAAVTARTKAIIPVHLYGKPMALASVMMTAERHDLFVVEDAAQSHGARRDGRLTGTVGALGCFSFHPSKNLAAAGDAGAICTNDATLAERVRVMRGLGQRREGEHVVLGVNSKLDAIQAVVLSNKLKWLDAWNASRSRVAESYRQRLADLPLTFQETTPDETHVFHLFQVRSKERDNLVAYLRNHGVDATIRYPTPIHLQSAFADMGWRPGQFPVAEALARELLCLPIRPDLTGAQIAWVSDAIHGFYGHRRKIA